MASVDPAGPTRADSLPVISEQFYIHTGVPGAQVRQSKHLTSWNLFYPPRGDGLRSLWVIISTFSCTAELVFLDGTAVYGVWLPLSRRPRSPSDVSSLILVRFRVSRVV